MAKASKPKNSEPKQWSVHDLWAKYEDIAMHFNDLLIKLRTQGLAAVAALITLVGIFTKTEPENIHLSWEIATAVLIGLAVFWIAIWIIDFRYYNRLLIGAVVSLKEIEAESRKDNPSLAINTRPTIDRETSRPQRDTKRSGERWRIRLGVWLFYIFVLAAILGGAGYCYTKELASHIITNDESDYLEGSETN